MKFHGALEFWAPYINNLTVILIYLFIYLICIDELYNLRIEFISTFFFLFLSFL